MKIVDEFIAEIKKFGVTQASRRSGVPVSTINGWVNDHRVPQLDKAQKVADGMGLEFLLFDKLEGE